MDEQLDAESGTVEEQIDDSAGTMECPNCGMTNDVGYRFCSESVDEHPASVDLQRTSDRPVGRFAK